MVAVRAFSIPGLKSWFYSNDHEPPHFHAKRAGAWEVKVYFLKDEARMVEVKWQSSSPAAKVLKTLTRLAAEHRDELIAEWKAIHKS